MAVTHNFNISNPVTVPVSPSAGEFLFFRVDAQGPLPQFHFSSDIKGILLNQGMFPQDPALFYEWTFLRDPSDIQQFELVTVALLFAANAHYSYRVNVHGPAGLIRNVLDIDYTGTAATDFDSETFRILIV